MASQNFLLLIWQLRLVFPTIPFVGLVSNRVIICVLLLSNKVKIAHIVALKIFKSREFCLQSCLFFCRVNLKMSLPSHSLSVLSADKRASRVSFLENLPPLPRLNRVDLQARRRSSAVYEWTSNAGSALPILSNLSK
jgi:hypothetical protein